MDALHYKLQPLVEALRTGKLEEAKDYFKGVEEAYEKAVATILQLEKMWKLKEKIDNIFKIL